MNYDSAKNLADCDSNLKEIYDNLLRIVVKVCPVTECSNCAFEGYMCCHLRDILESLEPLLDEEFVQSIEKTSNIKGMFPNLHENKGFPYCRRIMGDIHDGKQNRWYKEVHSTEKKRLGIRDGEIDW